MNKEKFAKAALDAIEEHISEEIGIALISEWTDHDVIDSGILSRSLADNGILSSNQNVALLEDVVSPLVFWQFYGATAEAAAASIEVTDAIASLASGGVSFSIVQSSALT